MRIRVTQNVVGIGVNYVAGYVQTALDNTTANDLLNAGQAILEGPAPSGVIGSLYAGAGYVYLTPNPSGYIGPTGYVPDAPAGGGFYTPDDYTLVVVYPGKRETTLDILKMRPTQWR